MGEGEGEMGEGEVGVGGGGRVGEVEGLREVCAVVEMKGGVVVAEVELGQERVNERGVGGLKGGGGDLEQAVEEGEVGGGGGGRGVNVGEGLEIGQGGLEVRGEGEGLTG